MNAGIYVDRESLIRREKAQVALRPVLRVNGRPTSLKLLEEPRLVLQSVDLQGISTEKEFPGLELREDAETVCEILVPENTVSLTATLKARIQNVSQNKKQDLAGGADVHAQRHRPQPGGPGFARHAASSAGYIVELRGKNGEPLPGEPLACAFKHRQFRDEVHAEPQDRRPGPRLAGRTRRESSGSA